MFLHLNTESEQKEKLVVCCNGVTQEFIIEVPSSKLNRSIGYCDWGYMWFYSVYSGEDRNSTLKQTKLWNIWGFHDGTTVQIQGDVFWIVRPCTSEILQGVITQKTPIWNQTLSFHILIIMPFIISSFHSVLYNLLIWRRYYIS